MTSVINSITRFLEVLTALNQHNGATVSEIAKLARLPRGTAHRIVETLRAHNYVRRDMDAGSVWLTRKVRLLSSGFERQSWIEQHAWPMIADFASRIGWDAALTTSDGGVILNRMSTHTTGPMAINPRTKDMPVPLLATASGHAYLAFAEPELRETLIRACLRQTHPQLRGTPEQVRDFRAKVETIRQRGYAWHDHVKHGTAVAVPFYAGVAVQGCISMHFPAGALERGQVEQSYLPQLWSLAEKIGACVEGLAEQPK
ncbi:MAG: helix-turn-helix domain-containing protein [Rhodospirillaceae bacterium]|nr:helix-turn-helix domain-containing protein [Rhodospirillaceae bacterium]